MPEDLPGNRQRPSPQQRSAGDEKKVQRVVQGEVVQRKKPMGKRFAEAFMGGDPKGVAGYVFFEVMIPGARDMAMDVVWEGLQRVFYGDVRSHRRGIRSGGWGGGHDPINYTRYSSTGGPAGPPSHGRGAAPSRRGRTLHDFDEIVLDKRHEAEEVIDRLMEQVERYEVATVADLYNMVGLQAAFTDEKWGWTDLRSADVSRIRGGYLLNLPRPEPID